MTHYDALGVHQSASFAEIRAADRKRALEVHPDMRTSDSAVLDATNPTTAASSESLVGTSPATPTNVAQTRPTDRERPVSPPTELDIEIARGRPARTGHPLAQDRSGGSVERSWQTVSGRRDHDAHDGHTRSVVLARLESP